MLPKNRKTIFAFFFFIVFISASFILPASSFAGWVINSGSDDNKGLGFQENINLCEDPNTKDISKSCYMLNSVIDTVQSGNCLLAGGYQCVPDPQQLTQFKDTGLISQTSKVVVALYETPPANTGSWIADTAQNIGIVPKAYAQGIGFSALSPLLSLWKVMRNVAYAALIIVLLAIGLMIMFRTKIDPRTVISVQAALPRIVMTLILITFSYPIAGFLIDLMYVVLFLGVSLLAPTLGRNAADIQAIFASGQGISELFGSLPNGWWIGGIVGIVSLFFLPSKLAGILGPLVGKATTAIGGGTATKLGLQAFGLVGGMSGLAVLLFLIVYLFALVRILFILLNAYIQIIISIIFAPIFLLGQAIPGQSSFSSWIKGLISNLSVFPTTAILLLVAQAVSKAFQKEGLNPLPIAGWEPPILGALGDFLGNGLIAFGFALVIPQIVISVKNLFGAKPAIPVGPGAILGPLVGGAQQAMQYMYYTQMLFGKRGEVKPVPEAAATKK